jgi:hypothetical protein
MLAAATAPVVARVDARSRPPTDYLARCVARLRECPDLGVVGAIQRPVAADDRLVARGVGRALGNPWLLGGAAYRRPGFGGRADTAYLGAYRRDELRGLGGFDERLAANEDFELAQRYRARGAGVWVEPGLEVAYEARSTLSALWQQYHRFGRAKAVYWRLTGRRPGLRQGIALAAPVVASSAVLAVAWRRPRLAVGLLAAGAGVIAAVDHLVAPREPDPRVRATALLGYATIVGAWVGGVTVGWASEATRAAMARVPLTRGRARPAGAPSTTPATEAAPAGPGVGAPRPTRAATR